MLESTVKTRSFSSYFYSLKFSLILNPEGRETESAGDKTGFAHIRGWPVVKTLQGENNHFNE